MLDYDENHRSRDKKLCDNNSICGYPLIEYKMCKGSDCLWISSKLINDFILQGFSATGEHKMTFSKPEWIEGKEDKPILLCLDDFSRGQEVCLLIQ